jgi:hypothetical protein
MIFPSAVCFTLNSTSFCAVASATVTYNSPMQVTSCAARFLEFMSIVSSNFLRCGLPEQDLHAHYAVETSGNACMACILRQPVLSAGFVSYLASVAMINICGVDKSLEYHGPGLLHQRSCTF